MTQPKRTNMLVFSYTHINDHSTYVCTSGDIIIRNVSFENYITINDISVILHITVSYIYIITSLVASYVLCYVYMYVRTIILSWKLARLINMSNLLTVAMYICM